MSLNKTLRPTRITFGDNGEMGKKNIVSAVFVKNDLKTPATANNTGILAAQTASASNDINITTGFGTLDIPRAVRVVVGGTAASVKAADITVYGTNVEGAPISEVFTPTVDTTGTLEGTKAFKTITGLTIPAQDGAGVTVSLGLGLAIGIGSRNVSTGDVRLYKKTSGGTESLVSPGSSTLSASNVEDNVVTLDVNPNSSNKYRVYVFNHNWHLNPINDSPNYGA